MFLHVTKVALAPRTMRCSVPALRRGHGSVRRSASRRFVRVGWLFISSGLRIRDRNRHPRPISAQRARDATYWPGHGPQRRAQAPRASSHVGSLLGWIPSVDRHGLRLKSQGGGDARSRVPRAQGYPSLSLLPVATRQWPCQVSSERKAGVVTHS